MRELHAQDDVIESRDADVATRLASRSSAVRLRGGSDTGSYLLERFQPYVSPSKALLIV